MIRRRLTSVQSASVAGQRRPRLLCLVGVIICSLGCTGPDDERDLTATCAAWADVVSSMRAGLEEGGPEGLDVVADDLRDLTEAAHRSGDPDMSAAADEARAGWAGFSAELKREARNQTKMDAAADAASTALTEIEDACQPAPR